jgi:tripartite-type tricarboxylate transporter receptor subunit TctC
MLMRRALLSLAISLLSAASPCAIAVDLPTTVVLVGSSPGGPADALARLLAEAMTASRLTVAVVENRAGGGGTIAAAEASRARTNQATVLVAGMGATVAAPMLNPRLRYDPERDLTPVALLATGLTVLVVPRELPADTPADLVTLARAAPGGGLTYGSSGHGSANHLCAEQFREAAGTAMLHVPFQGDAQAVASLISGDLQLMFMAPNVALPQIASGRLKALAVSGDQRLALLPEVPTMREVGLQEVECRPWTMAFVPSTAPAAAHERIRQAWSAALTRPEFRRRIEELGFTPGDAIESELQTVLSDTSRRLRRALPRLTP